MLMLLKNHSARGELMLIGLGWAGLCLALNARREEMKTERRCSDG
jgi:hypothetical protein